MPALEMSMSDTEHEVCEQRRVGISVPVFTSVSNPGHKKHNPSKPLVQTSGFISEEKIMAVKDRMYKSHRIVT